MDADLQSLLKAWLNDEIDEADMHPLLDRLRSDAEFRKAFVDEIVMLGRLKAVQSAEPRWLQLEDELQTAIATRTDDADFEDGIMRSLPSTTSRKRRHFAVAWSVGGVIAIALTLLACLPWIVGRLDDPESSKPPIADSGSDVSHLVQEPSVVGESASPRGVAVVSRTTEVEWGEADCARHGPVDFGTVGTFQVRTDPAGFFRWSEASRARTGGHRVAITFGSAY